MKNIVMISGHPNLDNSVANRTIIEETEKQLPEIQIRKLNKLYPNYQIDVQVEQAALEDVDMIILQFPLFWYAMPALLKKWIDNTFLRGFSHGPNATLKGKKLLLSFTTGIAEKDYQIQGLMKNKISTYIEPFEGIAIFCGLEFLQTQYLTNVSYTHRHTQEEVDQQIDDAKAYAKKLINLLKQFK